jgi:myo-inositol-1(or 4)-monophosphatase
MGVKGVRELTSTELVVLLKTMKSHEYLLAGAVDAAHEAGKVIRKHFTRKLQIRSKGKLGLVTNADVEAEMVAMRVLKKCQKDFAFLTEETNAQGVMKEQHSGLWIVDPLDGTTNFIHRFPMFCVTIAAEVKTSRGSEVVAAVTYHPILDELYTAIKGQGAFMNGKPMRVSQTLQLKDALFSTGFAYSKRDLLATEMGSFEKVSRAARAVRRPGSAALDLAYTARGVFDGFWERHLSPWDVAAGSLLISEAGGKVTGFRGEKFDPHGVEVLGTNKKLHVKIMKLI